MIAETSAVATVGVCLHRSTQGVWTHVDRCAVLKPYVGTCRADALFVLHRSLRPKAEARARKNNSATGSRIAKQKRIFAVSLVSSYVILPYRPFSRSRARQLRAGRRCIAWLLRPVPPRRPPTGRMSHPPRRAPPACGLCPGAWPSRPRTVHVCSAPTAPPAPPHRARPSGRCVCATWPFSTHRELER